MPRGNDKIFQKRKALDKRNLIRRESVLLERRRVLIVCEGEKTEPLYLKELVADLRLGTVEVCGDCGSAPTSVVKFGEKKFGSDPGFDLIYFVFDRDSHAKYDDALRMIETFRNKKDLKGKTVEAITSIPCFEIWFLLHFESNTKPCVASRGKSPCGNLISRLKKYKEFKGYNKGDGNHFKILHRRLNCAKKNAAQTLKQILAAGGKKHHGNPTTLMHVLVKSLEGLASDNKR